MKLPFVTAILSLGFALTPAAFAQNAGPHDQAAPPVSQTPQQPPQQWSGTQRVYDSGYGTESGGTSSASVAQKTDHGAPLSNRGRNGLFEHH